MVIIVSRGKKKPKISDLSHVRPTREEIDRLSEALEQAALHPAAAAILGASLVEHELEREIQRRLKCNDEAWEQLIGDMGPLRDFHSKILFGHAVRIYNDDVRFNLNIVRVVRNQFAHAKKLFDFDNPLIATEIKKARPITGERRDFHFVSDNKYGPQYAYISLCMLLTVTLIKRRSKATVAQTRRLKRKLGWAKTLFDVLIPPIDARKLPPLSSLRSQIGDPKFSKFGGLLGPALQKAAEADSKTDK